MTFKRLIPFLISLILVLNLSTPLMSANTNEILWDSWGVPHIYAQNSAALFKAFGWAQTHSHGNLLLKLYGQGRGKAAEYWGREYLSSDQYVRMMGIPQRAQQWYEQQTPEMQNFVDNFAQGINDYAKKHPDRLEDSLKAVLPITGVDIFAHMQRVIYFHFLTNPQQVDNLQTATTQAGSNAWAISPQKSATGNALLLANPHLPWHDLYLWYEAQLSAPNVDVYGATLVGLPVLAIAFNDYLGWTTTVNPIDGADIYQLTLKDRGYIFDGEVLPFKVETQTIKIKQKNGTYIEVPLTIKQSKQGVIIAETGKQAWALRVVGLDHTGGIAEFWQMAQAENLEEWESSLKRLQIPMFNFLYSDQKGNILYLFNGLVPKKKGDWEIWQKIINGDTAETLWTDYHTYSDLPRLLNPDTGWLQNTNDPPWSSTYPPQLKAEDYPAYLAPSSLKETANIFRTQRSIKLLHEAEKISLDQMIRMKFSSRLEMADRVLDYLLPAARLLANPIGIEAAEVLEKWDRQATADSRGAVLFMLWALTIEPNGLFSQPWNSEKYLTSPTGLESINLSLAVLEGVAAQVKLLYGDLAVSWGEVVKMRYGEQNLPASGAPGKLGSFRVLNLGKTKDEKFQAIFGDSYIAAVEFSRPIQAKSLLVYGNATQPGSPHIGDQLPLYLRDEMRPVWRNRQELEKNLELKEVIN
jgi:acyl-homoserine-lactone acylase